MQNKRTTIIGLILVAVGLALTVVGIWVLTRPDMFRAMARIRYVRDTEDIPGLGTEQVYDPYFIQTELEVIQSELILGRVIEFLDLNTVWGKRFDYGGKLTTSETLSRLRARLEIRPVRSTLLIDIRAVSEDAAEAAKIANAVANTYLAFRSQRRQELVQQGSKALNEASTRAKEKLDVETDKLERLKKELNVPMPEPADSVLQSNYKPYAEAGRELKEASEVLKLVDEKIDSERHRPLIGGHRTSQFIEMAKPANKPISPNRPLGVALTLGGMLAVGFEILQIRRSPASASAN